MAFLENINFTGTLLSYHGKKSDRKSRWRRIFQECHKNFVQENFDIAVHWEGQMFHTEDFFGVVWINHQSSFWADMVWKGCQGTP